MQVTPVEQALSEMFGGWKLVTEKEWRMPGNDLHPVAPYVVWSATSKAAADHVSEFMVGYRARVYAAVLDNPRADFEIEQITGLTGSTVRPRRGELVHAGLLEDSGTVRRTPAGISAVVWRVTDPPSPARFETYWRKRKPEKQPDFTVMADQLIALMLQAQAAGLAIPLAVRELAEWLNER